MKNSCLDAAIRELGNVGIRPTVDYSRKHICVGWDAGGRKRQYSMPLTPSDHRAHLNTRSNIRRMIREDKLDVVYAQKSQLEKALELPVLPPPESPDERIIRLENEVTGLIDLVFEQDEKLKKRPVIELRIDGVPMKIEPAPATVATEVPKGSNGYLLSVMPKDEWISVSDLAREAGLSQTTVSATLHYWKKKGRVEHKDRKWRKVAEIT
jgi:hypothetical protein